MSGAIGGASAVFAGSEAVPCGAYADDEAVQAASSRAANNATALPSLQAISSNCPRLTTSPNHPSAISSFPRRAADRSIGHFDLFRTLGLDPGPFLATRLDPAANPDASASQLPQIKTRRRETALVSFQDRNRNVPNRSPAEIHIDCGPAFAHGRHFALNQRKIGLGAPVHPS